MPDSTHAAVRASRRRPRAALTAAALCATTAALALSAAPAPAAVATGPLDAASGFPFSYDDDVQGFGVSLCQDDSGNCIETPRPRPSEPISVPDNFTPDEEGFWWLADATVPNAGTGLARFAKEAAFDTPGINLGHQVSFSRIRFRFTGLIAGDTYRVTHPYGVDELVAEPDPEGGGRINFTEDVGCIAPPCGAFPPSSGDRITAFLRWDPNVAPAAPAGYIGNPVIPHPVIGSPSGANFVRLEHLVPQPAGLPPVAELVGETDQFLVQGKLAGPPPPPAPHLGLNTTSLAFGSRQVGSPTAPRTVTVTNHGTADMTVGAVGVSGTDAGDFAAANDTCSGQALAPGASCTVDVEFAPAHAGDLGAALSIPSDAAGTPHRVLLSGIGVRASAPGGAPSPGPTTTITTVIPLVGRPFTGRIQGLGDGRMAVRSLRVARTVPLWRLRGQGLRLSMILPRGTQVLRIAVFRERGGRRSGRAIVRTVRLPAFSGGYVAHLRSRALLRALRPGRYLVEVTPGRDLDDRGATRRAAFRVTR